MAPGLGDVVGRDETRRPARSRSASRNPRGARAGAGRAPRAGLVEQHHRGVAEQADRDVHALAVAAGERPRDRRRGRAARSASSIRLDRPVDVGDALEPGEQAQVLLDGQPPCRATAAAAPSRPAVGRVEIARRRRAARRRGSRAASSCRRRSGPMTASTSPAATDTPTPAARRARRSDLSQALGPQHRGSGGFGRVAHRADADFGRLRACSAS